MISHISLVASRSGKARSGSPSAAFWFAWVCGLLCAGTGLAQERPQPAALPGKVITSVEQFWSLGDDGRRSTYEANLELIVYYYDPVWGLLWGEEQGRPAFLNVNKKPLPIRARQRIRIEGPALVGNGVDGEAARVTVLSEHEKLSPLVGNGQLFYWKKLNSRLVTLKGYVDRQVDVDANHLALSLIVDGAKVLGRVWVEDRAPVPQYEGSFVQIEGVFLQSADAAGQLTQIELWTSGPEHIQALGPLGGDPRFRLPRTPVESLAQAPANTDVRVIGIVKEQRPGFSVTLRDDTGQVVLETAQTDPLNPGDSIEAVGLPVARGLDWNMRAVLYRRSDAVRSSLVQTRLRLVDQVRALTLEEAERRAEVRLHGVVTWAHPGAEFFFLQDSSGGIRVDLPRGSQSLLPPVGALVDVSGVTGTNGDLTVVTAHHVARGSDVALPPARGVSLEQALTGVGDAQWVEMSGYLRQVSEDGAWTRLDLTTSSGEFSALLPATRDAERLLRAVVRVRGVPVPVFNDRRQVTRIQLWVSSVQDVQVDEPFPRELFSVHANPISTIHQFGFLQSHNRWVRTSGIVTLHVPGRYLFLQDGSDTLRVLSRDNQLLSPGDKVEVVGLPGREAGQVVLREAAFRRTEVESDVRPVQLPPGHHADRALEGRLVQIKGHIVEVSLRSERPRLTLRADDLVVECVSEMPWSAGNLAARWQPGAVVTATGVYRLERDEYQEPYSFHVQLRTPEDIAVLQAPPWWTARRAIAVAGALGVLAAVGVVGVVTLRRRVRQQLEQIRQQLEKQARLEAELERSSRLESLGVLAGGIAHDFNNLLTVVVGNITLALSDAQVSTAVGDLLRDAVRGAMRARDLTQQLLTFARGGDPVRQAVSLPEVVREAAEFALHGSKTGTEFDVAPGLWPADVDKGQIGQVVHNIALNAAQAMPNGGTIRFRLENDTIESSDGVLLPGRYVKLTAIDNGPGIAPEHLGRIFDPYFSTKPSNNGLGLATVRSIVKKHQGHIEVESKPGTGTTFRVWLPAAQAPVEKPAVEPPRQDPAPTGRPILFMDDDDSIRRIAAILLKRLGYDFTIVADGAQAVEAYRKAKENGRPYGVVIMDLTIPGGMGGREAMQELLKIDPGVRAIVSSGYSSDPVLSDFRNYGFRAIVAKPYDVNALSLAIRNVLAEDSAPQEPTRP